MNARTKAFALAAELSKKKNSTPTPNWLMQPKTLKTGSVRPKHSSVPELNVESFDPKTQKAFLRAHESLKKEKEKKEIKKIKVVEYIPERVEPVSKKGPKKQCVAKTMNGKQCPFSATQGKFCKKHKIVDKDIF